MTFLQFAYRNVVRNRRIYAGFFMASVFSVTVFFLYSMLLFHPTIEDRFVQEIAVVGMGIAEITLFIFTVFFLFYSMRAFLQARSHEFGILLHLGMEKRQLNRLVFLETMFIGISAIGIGTSIGFTFSKFFFMVVREIVMLPALPLYVSWQPFALTIGAFLGLFMVMALLTPYFIQSGKVVDLIRGEITEGGMGAYSKIRGYLGLLFLGLSYLLAALTSQSIVLSLFIFLPPLAMIGTYFFFKDSVPLLLHKIQGVRRLYWRGFRILSISEGIVRLRENAQMFFIVTIVSTLAFMSVGTLASLTSFASQYRELNPLALVYASTQENPDEQAHIELLFNELEAEEIDYVLTKFRILKQTSTFTDSNVGILNITDVNKLAIDLGYLPMRLVEGEALFLPPSSSSFESLNERTVQTTLEESDIDIKINGAYPYHLFASNSVGQNVIVLNDFDYRKILSTGGSRLRDSMMYYAFHVPEWEQTKDVGFEIEQAVTESFILNESDVLPYSFDNPGSNYAIIRTTFSLLLFIGLLLAVVFLLAAGSFIYFRLYTTLEQDRKKFDVLRRLGITDRELKKIINRQLIPQFFFPWGVALLHSSFAFLSLQVIWDALAEISIVKELVLVLLGFTILQGVYFYLIRWRYLTHIKASE